MRLTITLPLPHKNLSPNARVHWRTKADATAKARRDARLAATSIINQTRKTPPKLESATMQATFYFRDSRRRDKSNAASSLKAYEDGFTDAGVWRDDSGVTHLPVVFLTDRVNPRVELTITPDAAGVPTIFLEGETT